VQGKAYPLADFTDIANDVQKSIIKSQRKMTTTHPTACRSKTHPWKQRFKTSNI